MKVFVTGGTGVPVLAYHATDLDGFDTTDAVGIVVSLAIAALAGLLALAAPAHPAPRSEVSAPLRAP